MAFAERFKRAIGLHTEEEHAPMSPAEVTRRLGIAPESTAADTRLIDARAQRLRESREREAAVTRCLIVLSNNLHHVERADQYLSLLDTVFTRQSADDTVVQRVCEHIRTDLIQYYTLNAGSKTILYQENGHLPDSPIPLIPISFQKTRMLAEISGLAERLETWPTEWLQKRKA